MCHGSEVVPKEAAGAPEKKMKVTPEMIRAGLAALEEYKQDEDNEVVLICSIFYSMRDARG
jgi:hypothetical protein